MFKKITYNFIFFTFFFILGIFVLEQYFKYVHNKELKKRDIYKNLEVSPLTYHPTIGWVFKKNFDYEIPILNNQVINKTTNNLGLASDYDIFIDEKKFNIFVLGDSFSEALGVDTQDSWPNLLKNNLIKMYNENIELYNLSVAGYNLDQYYFRLKEFLDLVKPDLLILGLSTATDFYDVGYFNNSFVYGKTIGRNYLEIKNNILSENTQFKNIENLNIGFGYTPFAKSERQFVNNKIIKKNNHKFDILDFIKYQLGNFIIPHTYAKIKRSKVMIWFASKSNLFGISLWPGIETAMMIKKNHLKDSKVLLVKEILNKINNYSKTKKIPFYVVHIPYQIEVDENLWNSTYNKSKIFSNREPEDKIKKIAEEIKLNVIYTRDIFIKKSKSKSLYIENDGHLNIYGNFLMKDIVLNKINSDNVIDKINR